MAQNFGQPSLLDESGGGDALAIHHEAGRIHFIQGEFSGIVTYGWHADGEDAPWDSVAESDVASNAPIPDHPPEPPDDEFEGIPDWLVEQMYLDRRHLGDVAVAAEQSLMRDAGVADVESPAGIGPNDVRDQQRIQRAVIVRFAPHSAGLHRHTLNWIYWERCEGELSPKHIRSLVEFAVRALSTVERMSAAARGGIGRHGTNGLQVIN